MDLETPHRHSFLNSPALTGGSGTRPHLAYTVAFDPPGGSAARVMAKLLVASLTRTHFSGDIVIFSNSETPLFMVERKGVHEVFVETPPLRGLQLARHAMNWKHGAGRRINGRNYDKVLFLDADCLVLRNLDHLLTDGGFISPAADRNGTGEAELEEVRAEYFESDWDILYQEERGRSIQNGVFNSFLTEEEMRELKRPGINSGTWAVRGEVYNEVMEEWERIDGCRRIRSGDWSDQSAWNRLILDAGKCSQGDESGGCRWQTKRFEVREIQFPLHLDPDFLHYRHAAILHAVGGTSEEKTAFLQAVYLGRFFGDPSGLFLNLLDM